MFFIQYESRETTHNVIIFFEWGSFNLTLIQIGIKTKPSFILLITLFQFRF